MKQYEIEYISGVVVIRLKQLLSFEKLENLVHEIAELDSGTKRLWDVTAVFDYTPDQIQQLAELGKQLWPGKGKVAYVAENELAYGLIRMFEAYRDQDGYLTHVFSDESKAMAWLTDDNSEL